MTSKGKQFPFFIPVIAQDRVSRVMDRIKKAIPDKLKAGFGSFATGVSQLTTRTLKGVGIVVGGATAALGGLIALVNSSAARGDSLVKLADRIGLTVEALQEWDFAAQRSGLDEGQFGAASQTFAKRLGELKAGRGALLGLAKRVSPDLAEGLLNSKDTNEAMKLVLTAIGQIEDGEKRMALSAAAFSKANAKMVNLAMAGPDAWAEMAAEARKYGILSEEQARSSGGWVDTMFHLQTAWRGLRDVVAGAAMPVLTKLFQQLADWMASQRGALQQWAQDFASRIPGAVEVARGYLLSLWEWMQPLIERFQALENKGELLRKGLMVLAAILASPLIAAIVNIVLGLGQMAIWFAQVASKIGFVSSIGKALVFFLRGLLVKAIAIAVVALKGLFALMLANPIGAIIALIGAVVLAFYKWDTIKGWLSGLWDWIKGLFGKGIEWISGALGKLLDWLPDWFGGGGSVEVSSQPAAQVPDVTAAAQRLQTGAVEGLLGRILVDFRNAPSGTSFELESFVGPSLDLEVGYALPAAG